MAVFVLFRHTTSFFRAALSCLKVASASYARFDWQIFLSSVLRFFVCQYFVLAVASAGWTEIPQWDTSGIASRAGLFTQGTGFDAATGRFYASVSGVYFAASQLRVDAADLGAFGIAIVLNAAYDADNGLYTIDGHPSSDYSSLSTSGVFRLQNGDFIDLTFYVSII